MKKILKCFSLFCLLNNICCFDFGNLMSVDPDFSKTITEFISSNGYPVQEYVVQTPDGYLLSLQRIPYGKNESNLNRKRPAVLLVHGVLTDCAVFVWNFPEQSLGFVLADNGYDVWMGNLRGSTSSRRNVRLSPEQNEFWDFSIDEKANIDVPTFIDFVLRQTEQKRLSYVGYSEGTTVAFALLSRSLEYNKKINLFAAYGPATFVTYARGLLGLVFDFFVFIQPFYKEIGFVNFLTNPKPIELFSKFVCGSELRFICEVIYYATLGFDPAQLNKTRLPVYYNQLPAGDSTKTLIQFSQLKYSGKFQMYNYFYQNQERYNQDTPPEYDLSKISAPVALFSGVNDPLADPIDVNKLRNRLKSIVEDYIVPNPLSQHADFILGINSYSLIHKRLLSTLEKYSTN